MNAITLVGRLVADPESKTSSTGKTVTTIRIAVRKKFKPQDDSQDSDFFTVEAWGKDAEYLATYGQKGRDIAVFGRMESRSYNDKDGGKRTMWDVKAERVSFIGGVRDSQTAPTTNADAYDPFGDE